jgi:putative DNA primase/helicase
MRKDEFEFRPNLKLLIIGNHKPRVSNVDDAMKRRLNLLPLPVQARDARTPPLRRSSRPSGPRFCAG